MIIGMINTTNAMYKKISFLFLAFIALNTIAQEDEPGDREEKIESLKRAFITEKLDLSVEEAEKFWPVYNAYNKDKKANRKELKDLMHSDKLQTPDKKTMQDRIRKGTELRIKEVQRDEQFLTDCLEILPPEKVMRLTKIEKEFREKLMDRMRERRQGGPGGPGGRRPGMRR